MYKLKELVFATVILFGPNVMTWLGIDHKVVYAGLVALACGVLLLESQRWRRNKQYVMLLIVSVLISLYMLFTDKSEGVRVLALSLLGPSLMIGVFDAFSTQPSISMRNHWRRLTKLFFVAFIAVAGLAIYERVVGHTTFGWIATNVWSIQEMGEVGFRSTAIYGHPLYNALMISTAMAFILCSSLKPKYKLFLWCMGYIAVLCFNTRGSIVGNALLLGTYVLYSVTMNRKMSASYKRKLLILSLVAVAACCVLFFSVGLGGRLMEMGLFDESSAQVRVDSWAIFSRVDWRIFLLGMNYDEAGIFMVKVGLVATENFWLDWLLRLGFVFMIPYIMAYFFYVRLLTKNYSMFHKLFVSGAFILIASTNNSLSANYIALFYFMLLLKMFDPNYFNLFVPIKYVESASLRRLSKINKHAK